MILKKLAIIQRSKMPHSSKPKNSRKKLRGRKRRHRKRPINIGQNKQVGTTRFERSKPATTSFRDKKTTCFSVLVRRNNLDLRTGPVRNCSTVQTRNDPNYPSSKAT